jgi:hypothetical protein
MLGDMTAIGKGSLIRQLQDMRGNKLSGQDLYRVIHHFGRASKKYSRPVVEPLLTHEDALLRWVVGQSRRMALSKL